MSEKPRFYKWLCDEEGVKMFVLARTPNESKDGALDVMASMYGYIGHMFGDWSYRGDIGCLYTHLY